jgi:hypothetical protein
VLSFSEARAQENKSFVYRMKIEKINGDRLTGYLLTLGDSSVTMAPDRKLNISRSIAISDIKLIRLRRKNSVGRGLLIGLGTGAVLGTAIGYMSYTPCNCWIDFGPGLSAIAGGIIGVLGGSAFGAMAGTANKNFVIDGDMIKYNQLRYNPVFYQQSIMTSTAHSK